MYPILPLQFVLFQASAFIIYTKISIHNIDIVTAFVKSLWISLFLCLVYGYLYMTIAFIIKWLFQVLKLVKNEEPTP